MASFVSCRVLCHVVLSFKTLLENSLHRKDSMPNATFTTSDLDNQLKSNTTQTKPMLTQPVKESYFTPKSKERNIQLYFAGG